jgi:putative endonuclease
MVVRGTTIHEFLATRAISHSSCVHGGVALHHDQPSRRDALYRRDHRVGCARLAARAWQHRTGAIPGFTKKYGLTRLVYVETHETINTAIRRERTLKTWRRAWKVRLITEANPNWDDLYDQLLA